jgi:hypothetical protein
MIARVVRPAVSALALLAAAVLAGGCSKQEPPVLPAACKGGTDAVLAALARAPAQVKLEDETLSDCMRKAQSAGDVQELGASFVRAAERLADRVRIEPEGAAATQLGYLVGAARRGATRNVGAHEEMVRRVEQELVPLDTHTAAFSRGERAGRTSG